MAARPPLWREPAPPQAAAAAAVSAAPLLYPLPSLTATGSTAAMAPVAAPADAALGAGRSRSGSVASVGPPPAAARPAVTGLSPADFRARLTQLLEQSPALDAAKAVLRRQLIEQLTHGGAFAQAALRRPPADPTVLRLIADYLRAHTLPFAAAILKSEAGAAVPLLGEDVRCEMRAMVQVGAATNASRGTALSTPFCQAPPLSADDARRELAAASEGTDADVSTGTLPEVAP